MTDNDNRDSRESRGPATAPSQEGRPQPSRFGGPQAQRPEREGDGERRRPGGGGRRSGGGRYSPRRKVCAFCVDNIGHVDYKDIARLRRHVGERGKIEPRRKLGTCARHQRSLTVAIKRARYIGLIPFTSSTPRG
jgi:small subunit ribosomal protein S18